MCDPSSMPDHFVQKTMKYYIREKIKLATEVEGDSKAPFSLATTIYKTQMLQSRQIVDGWNACPN